MAPFDAIFATATFGNIFARIALLAIMAWAGWLLASQSGLSIESHGAKRPVLIGIAAALAVAIYVAILDCYLFKSLLSSDYSEFIRQPLILRLSYFMMRAFVENIIYRLFVFSFLFFVLRRLRIASGPTIVGAMILTQCINIGANVVAFVPEPITAQLIFYDAIRYVAPGVFWAWIYLRFGFVTSEVASVGCHIFLQPIFSMLFVV
ncbi:MULTISPECIES: hypothetical protein [unclassified Bradyrhizobium]